MLIDPSEEWERVGGGDDGDDVCASVDVDADGGRRVESMAAVCRRGWRPAGIVVATVTPSAETREHGREIRDGDERGADVRACG